MADIALLERREGRFTLTDSYRQTRVGRELLIAACTIRRGEIVRNGTYVLCIDVEGPGGGKLRRKVAVVR